ncbi:hypothetical protein FACS189445_1330 [Spirochaetia bacterium]|nr:hypothetical protein FACS189445_1330 [Spirochaetia bacterium]
MPKRRTSSIKLEAEINPEREAANRAGELRRKKEADKRRANAEKQRRFRESMKAGGAKQVLLWDTPLPSPVQNNLKKRGYEKIVAWEQKTKDNITISKADIKIAIGFHESSLGIATTNPKIKAALSHLGGSFILELKGLPPEEWSHVYQDLLAALKPFGDIE